MATSQAASAGGGGGGTTSTTSQTIVGSHIFKIEGFSATKDLGVGRSVKSSTFRVGGYGWYIECYPCGVNEGNAGWVYLNLCRQEDHPGSRVWARCKFILIESLKDDGSFKNVTEHPGKLVTMVDDDKHSLLGTDFIKRKKLESLLKDDCFHVLCVVNIEKFPVVPQGVLPTRTVAGSHVLTIDEYSKIRRGLVIGAHIGSSMFCIGGHSWYFDFYPCGEDEDDDDDNVNSVSVNLFHPGSDDIVKARIEITLLTRAGQIISSNLDFNTFSERSNEYRCSFLINMEHETSPLLQDCIQIKCDIAVVNGITATPNLSQGISRNIQGSQHVRGNVTFDVGGHLFTAHKCVLATRCTAFMSEFFGQAGKDIADVTDQPVRVDGLEPRVFEALLHFIYNDALPEVSEEDKIVMAEGLVVAADRYAMEGLKLICADILCSYMNNAHMAVNMLELAVKHGCHKLKEKCKELLKGHLAKVAP